MDLPTGTRMTTEAHCNTRMGGEVQSISRARGTSEADDSIPTCQDASNTELEDFDASAQHPEDGTSYGSTPMAMPSPRISKSWTSPATETETVFDDVSSGRDHFGPNSRDFYLYDMPCRSPSPSQPRSRSRSFLPSMKSFLNRRTGDSRPEDHTDGATSPTNSDESHESMRNTMLMEQWQEICRLESLRVALESDLELVRSELKQTQEQIDIQSEYIEALQARVKSLESQLQQSPNTQHDQIIQLSKQLHDARMFEQTRLRTEEDGISWHYNGTGYAQFYNIQLAILHEHIEKQQLEIIKWKQEAMGRGRESVSMNWQASVDEAVRREREKDSGAIKALLDELSRLRAMLARVKRGG